MCSIGIRCILLIQILLLLSIFYFVHSFHKEVVKVYRGDRETRLHIAPIISLDREASERQRTDLLKLCDAYISSKYNDPSTDYKKEVSEVSLIFIEQKIRILIEQLSVENPSVQPLQNWPLSKDKKGDFSILDGIWQIRYNNVKHERAFDQDNKLFTYLVFNSTEAIINHVKQKDDNSRSRVPPVKQTILKAKRISDRRLHLQYKMLKYGIGSGRFSLTIPYPRIPFTNAFREFFSNSKFLSKPIGSYLDILYVDDEICIIKCNGGDGYIILCRLYEVWEPMQGWKLINMV